MSKRTELIVSGFLILTIIMASSINKKQQDQLKRLDNLQQEIKKTKEQNEIEEKKREEDLNKQIEELRKTIQAKKVSGYQIQIAIKTQGSGSIQATEACYEAVKAIWPENLQKTAIAIVIAESGGNPKAVSRTNDHGCFQINHGLQNYGEQIYDPITNARIAYQNKYLRGGWTHWTVYNTGAYLKYLN